MKEQKKLLSFIFITLIASLLIIGVVAADTVIVHTNDVHGNLNNYIGYDGLSSYIHELKSAGNDVVILSAGDETQGLFNVGYTRGEIAIDIMNKVGYQAMAVGNHEFDYGWKQSLELADKAEFPFLAANIFYAGTKDLVFQDSVIIDTSDWKIGVFGIATPESKTKSLKVNTDGIDVADAEELYAIAKSEVDSLKKEGCNLIICLSHLGTEDGSKPNRSIDLAENVAGINLIIDGHSHTEYPNGLKVGNTLIASTGCNLKNIGVVTVAKDGSLTAKLVSDYTKKDPAITAMIDDNLKVLNNVYGYQVGTSKVLLNAERNPGVRTEETNFGDLIADSFLWEAKKLGYTPDAAIIHGGAIRESIPEGTFTMMDIYNVLPSSYELEIAKVTGDMLLKDIEANTGSVPDAEGGFPQVSGIKYTIDTSKKYVDGEVNRVTIESVGGKPFDKDAVYLLVSTDQVLTGGDKYRYMVQAEIEPIGITYEAALKDYIESELDGVVDDAYRNPQGRITIVSASNVPTSPLGIIGVIAGIFCAAGILISKRK